MNCSVAKETQELASAEATGEIGTFLRENGPCYLATVDGYQARVRPIEAYGPFGGKLYFLVGRDESLYRQLKSRPRVEIAAFDGSRCLRLAGFANEDDRVDAAQRTFEGPGFRCGGLGNADGALAVFCMDVSAARLEGFSSGFRTVLASWQ